MVKKVLASIDFGLSAFEFVLFVGNAFRGNLLASAICFGSCIVCGAIGAAILFNEE